MGLGTSLVLLAIGAILDFAVNVNTPGFNIHTVGVVSWWSVCSDTGVPGLLEQWGGFGTALAAGGGWWRTRSAERTRWERSRGGSEGAAFAVAFLGESRRARGAEEFRTYGAEGLHGFRHATAARARRTPLRRGRAGQRCGSIGSAGRPRKS